jgi:hypothetical protein
LKAAEALKRLQDIETLAALHIDGIETQPPLLLGSGRLFLMTEVPTFLRCQMTRMALLRQGAKSAIRSLSGGKRTLHGKPISVAIDPLRTSSHRSAGSICSGSGRSFAPAQQLDRNPNVSRPAVERRKQPSLSEIQSLLTSIKLPHA